MSLNILQSLGVALGVLAVLTLFYAGVSDEGHEVGLKRLTKFLLFLCGVLVFACVNLLSSIKDDIRMREVVDKYGRTSTIELIAYLRSDATAEVGEGMIIFNRGTEQEKIFIVLHDPVFTIMDQSKLVEMHNELNP